MPAADSVPSLWPRLLLVALVAGLAAAAGVPAHASYGARLTADEPYYLLSATSLAEDGDLDIRDELAERRYLPYHRITVDEQTLELQDGRRLSPHDPGLSLLLAAPMHLGGWVAAKATLAILAAVTAAATCWLAVRRFAVGVGAATLTVMAATTGLPLAAYGSQVYPELPASLVVVGVVAAITGPGLARHHVALALAGIVALPWLAVKYVPVAAVLGIGLLIAARRSERRLGPVIATAVAMAAVYVTAHQTIYGGWTVYAAGDHFARTGEFSVVGNEVDLVGRSRRLIGLLVDRDFGLVAWAPIWALLVPALAAWWRNRAQHRMLVAAVIAVTWANATFIALTMHGFWVPGRQLVVALPLAAIPIAAFLDQGGRRLRATAVAAAIAGTTAWGHLAWEAAARQRTLVVDFADTGGWWHRGVRPLLPDGQAGATADDLGLLAWVLLLVVLAVVGWRSAPARSPQG